MDSHEMIGASRAICTAIAGHIVDVAVDLYEIDQRSIHSMVSEIWKRTAR